MNPDTVKIPLANLKALSSKRPAGYYDDVVGSGEVIGDSVYVSKENYVALTAKYRAPSINKPIADTARTAIFNFFANPFVCDWEGCNELHALYAEDLNKLAAGCSNCQLNAIKTKYSKLIVAKLNELSTKPTDNN